MKHITLTAICAVFLFSCTSPEHKLISEHIKTYLPDIDSYDAIEHSDAVPYMSRLDENIAYNLLVYRLDSLSKRNKNLWSDVQFLGKLNFKDKKHGATRSQLFLSAYTDWSHNNEDIESSKLQIDSIKTNFISIQLGHEIKHKFRAKNSRGGYVIEEFFFVTDMDKTKLIKVYPITENKSSEFIELFYYDALSLGL